MDMLMAMATRQISLRRTKNKNIYINNKVNGLQTIIAVHLFSYSDNIF